MIFYKRKIFWLIFLVSFTVIISRYAKIKIHDTGYAKAWYYGDAFSENNVESAAKFYLEKGFKPNCGLPTYGYNDDIAGNETVYTHYPPLSEWIGGVMAKIFNDYHDQTLSLLPLLLSLILFFLIYKIIGEITQNSEASFISASLLVLSNYFVCWADDIHQHVYVEFCRWLFVYLWYKYLISDKKNYVNLGILCILYAAMCLLSFEPYVYTAIIVVGFSWVLRKKIISWEIILLLIVPLLMFFLRLNLNANYLGGYEAMIKDIQGALVTRLGTESGYSELGRAMTLKDYLLFLPKTRIHRLGHFYILPSIGLIYLSILALKEMYSKNVQLFKLCVVVYLAAISWILAMPQHALIHLFTIRHLAIFVGLSIGFGIMAYRKQLVNHFKGKKYVFMAMHLLFLTYTLVYAVVNTFYFVYIKYGLMYPRLGVSKIEEWEHFFW